MHIIAKPAGQAGFLVQSIKIFSIKHNNTKHMWEVFLYIYIVKYFAPLHIF